jgi:FixJ family two-component response regulator
MSSTCPFAVIVDDEDTVCRAVAETLSDLGVESMSYRSAKSAIASLDARWPEIIFLDVALQHSGAVNVLKGLNEKRYTGIVELMSGGSVVLLAAIQRAAVHYGLALWSPLRKPLRSEAIRRMMRKLELDYAASPLITGQTTAADRDQWLEQKWREPAHEESRWHQLDVRIDALHHYVIQMDIGRKLRSYFDLPQEMPHAVLALLMQLNEPPGRA